MPFLSYLSGTMAYELKDTYGRSFKSLRISLTNSCNLGCIYCVHTNEPAKTEEKKVFQYEELAYMVEKIHEVSPLKTIHITGGEPTLYKDLVPFIEKLKAVGIPTIKMTSNGYRLAALLPGLYEAGLKKINISLDAVNPASFKLVSGRTNLVSVLQAIDQALEYGMEIKLNAVIMKMVNEDQIIPLLKFAMERNISLRFLELMRMGPLYQHQDFDQYFFPEEKILEKVRSLIDFTPVLREESATANYWITESGYKFGIIANESSPFCKDCDRLRLDSFGNIFGCLSNDTAISIAGILENELFLKEKLTEALSYKQAVRFTGSALSMRTIGG
jgi:GTP 3',8-cyclase